MCRRLALIFAVLPLLTGWHVGGSGLGIVAQDPGPSLALFNTPYYSCVTNYYVSTTGSDSNNGTSPSTPWLTLQHANNSLPTGGAAAGSCVNVAPGTYAAGVQLSNGGNLASSTGYVAYRCETLDGCTITTTSGAFVAGLNRGGSYPNYIIIDGFSMPASATVLFDAAVTCENGNSGTVATGCHHWMVLNNVIYNHGQGGIGLNDSEFFYISHNTVYNTAIQCGGGVYGSGIAVVTPKVVSGYSPTADNANASNNAALNLIGVQGTTFPFHILTAWNVVHNNYQGCGPPASTGYTDGNGIIMDSFGTQNGNPVSYTQPTLVAFNVSYNNGGGGIHIFASEDVAAANNSSYNSGIDPNEDAAGNYAIDTNQSYGNTLINNIAVSIPAAPSGSCSFGVAPYAQWNAAILGGPPASDPADTFSRNVTQLQGGNNSCWGSSAGGSNDAPTGENPMFNADVGQFSCSSNKCATSPLWSNVGNTSTGNLTTAPNGSNFALQSGSPAIGYGLTESYLPAQSVDVGACYHTLATCP